MKLGITGAGGYIGLRLVQKLHKKHEIVSCDHGYMQGVTRVGDIDIVDADIRDLDRMIELFKDVDVVVHLAAVSGVVACNRDCKTAFQTNIVGTHNLAFVCREYGIPLIFASSMAIFGNIRNFPIAVGNNGKKPESFYGFTKYAGGNCIEIMAKERFPATIFVMSNVYGGYRANGKSILKKTVVNLFVENALRKEPLSVYEPGTQARNFLHIDDAVRGYEKAIEALQGQPAGATYLPLAGKDYCSITELAEIVQDVSEKETGFSPEMRLVENPRNGEAFMDRFDVDISETTSLIGYGPRYSLEKGVERTFQVLY